MKRRLTLAILGTVAAALVLPGGVTLLLARLNAREEAEAAYKRRISELRIVIDYESALARKRAIGRGRLNLDIVDYPGEWLLDLPLLGKDFATWSGEAIARAERPSHRKVAKPWLERLAKTGVRAFLVGESLMRQPDVIAATRALLGAP